MPRIVWLFSFLLFCLLAALLALRMIRRRSLDTEAGLKLTVELFIKYDFDLRWRFDSAFFNYANESLLSVPSLTLAFLDHALPFCSIIVSFLTVIALGFLAGRIAKVNQMSATALLSAFGDLAKFDANKRNRLLAALRLARASHLCCLALAVHALACSRFILIWLASCFR